MTTLIGAALGAVALCFAYGIHRDSALNPRKDYGQRTERAMRDTSNVVPGRDPLSGAPLGDVLLSYRVGVPPRPITTIAVATEPFTHASWVLWHTLRNRYLYRTTASTPRATPNEAVVANVEMYRLLLTVAGDSWHAVDPGV